ncbi:MAG: FAD:protein FMN transferase [Bacteroidota bacterium]
MRRLLLILLLLPACLIAQQNLTYRKSAGMMGSQFGLTATSPNDSLNRAAVRAGLKEIQRIENLISSWDKNSQTSEINRQAGIKAVKVDWELYSLINRSLKIAKLTEGAFDISFASADRIWKFDGSMQGLPTDSAINASVSKINYENIQLNPQDTSVFLLEKGMKIGFGGIGKGYAANRASLLMHQMGIKSGLVNAGGDIICWGRPAERELWRIGIADPKSEEKMLAWLGIKDLAVVTSGDYERFAMIEGKRYAHIINPKTGWPVSGLKSVTILCPDAELADALATSVFVLGREKGLALINQLKDVEGLLLTDEDELLSSQGIEIERSAAGENTTYQLKLRSKKP